MNIAASMAQSNIYRNRLIFRSWHRGTQESDFLLGSFADDCLAGLDDNQLQCFEALLDCPRSRCRRHLSGRG
jgi:antitoxin CptB